MPKQPPATDPHDQPGHDANGGMPSGEQASGEPDSILRPLAIRDFRNLWFTWLAANTSMWMNDVASAWLMATLTSVPLWVALVQTASTLPVFLLGLPSGALADILDRKRYFLLTQYWIAGVALLLCACIVFDLMSPPLLLALSFANGVGLAMRWPVYAAIVPALVPRAMLPSALALNSVSGNSSRIVGPLVAGLLIASAGSVYVYALNAVLAVGSAIIITRWRAEPVERPLGRERLLSAMRVGMQFMWQSAHLQGVLVRVCLYFFHSTALLALLPLAARDMRGGGASTFATLIACMGGGALLVVTVLPEMRRRWSRDDIVMRGALLQSVAMVMVALAPNVWVAVPAMVLCGMAWISAINVLSVSAQLGLPDWVRARGMSFYQMAIMGGTALGAALWGQVATLSNVHTAMLVAAVSSVLCMAVVTRFMVDDSVEEDLSPTDKLRRPVVASPPASGHVVTTIEYRIDPARADEFIAVMRQSRRYRLRLGALSWELLRDIGDPGHYTERIVDSSWSEHLRRFERASAADVALRDRRNAFHVGPAAPRIRRHVEQSVSGGPG